MSAEKAEHEREKSDQLRFGHSMHENSKCCACEVPSNGSRIESLM